MNSNNSRIGNFVAAIFCLLYIAAGALVSVHRFWQYEVFYYDFGIFDAAIWHVSRFRPPIIDHLEIGGKIIFADHFNPSIFLLSPLYWITSRPEALLIAQAVIVGLSGWVLYRIGKKVLKNDVLSFAVTFSYLLFVGLQNAIISDFHEVTVMTLPLMLTFWSIVANKKNLYWVFLLITLGFKESTFLLGAGIAALLWFTKPDWRKTALATLALSAVWGWATTRIIIPSISGKPYSYTPDLPQGIPAMIQAFFDKPLKIKTLLVSFGSFGFLPLLTPPMWPLVLQDFFVRFVPNNTDLRWDLGLHYSAQLAPIMGVATIIGLSNLRRVQKLSFVNKAKLWAQRTIKVIPNDLFMALLLIAIALYLHQFKLHGPLGLAYNPAFYRHTGDFRFLDDLVSRIPKGTTVMAQNNIAPHLIHTNTVFLLRDHYATFIPMYIVLDMRQGQNPNDFFGTKKPQSILTMLQKDPNYILEYQTSEQYIFRRVQ